MAASLYIILQLWIRAMLVLTCYSGVRVMVFNATFNDI